MVIIKARKLLAYTPSQLWSMLTGRIMLVFDDGMEKEHNYKEVLYSSYFWDFHRVYQNTPLLYKHSVQSVLKGNQLSSDTHIELLNNIFWDVLEAYNSVRNDIKPMLTKMVFQITNNVYNDLIHMAEKYVTSIDILDFIEVNEHPAVKESFKNLEPTALSIDKSYRTIMDVVNNDPSLNNNALVKATKSKIVNKNQVLQCVGPRGFISEVDGAIMQIPVTRSYTQGMRTLYNTIAESRTAAKSLYFSESPLQDSEYFARRLQFVSMHVEGIYRGDCGSNRYLNWTIKPEQFRDGKSIYPGDLKFMIGKYYLNEETNTLGIITKDSTDLIGKTVKLRSVLNCKHPDSHKVCSVCFGEMSENVPDYANLGHMCAATMTNQSTQSVLSTKHLDNSSSFDPIIYNENLLKYFKTGTKNTTSNYLFRQDVLSKNLKLVISRDEAFGLTDILLTDTPEDISPSRISSVKEIGVAILEMSQDSPEILYIGQYNRNCILTTEFLIYAKENKWEVNAQNAFVFDMSKWDHNKPVFKLPDMEYSYSNHSHQIARIIESRMKEIEERSKPESAVLTLIELFDLVNSKISVNIALLEVIIYAMMVADRTSGNYFLARNSENASLGVSDDVIHNRSMSLVYAYEEQYRLIEDPKSFFQDGRPDSIFDVFINPHEVLKHTQ